MSNMTLMPGQVLVSQREFFDIALHQIGELWSRSSLLEIWADGGIPRDPYFHRGITALRDKYQSSAAIYNGFPTFNDTAVRWIGNEDGAAPDPTWSSGSCDMGNGGHGPGKGHATIAPDSLEWTFLIHFAKPKLHSRDQPRTFSPLANDWHMLAHISTHRATRRRP